MTQINRTMQTDPRNSATGLYIGIWDATDAQTTLMFTKDVISTLLPSLDVDRYNLRADERCEHVMGVNRSRLSTDEGCKHIKAVNRSRV